MDKNIQNRPFTVFSANNEDPKKCYYVKGMMGPSD